jgi:uncharacterized protein YdaU (DUF1376 family)
VTAPLVPPDLAIPRLPWVPIYADRLWESNFFAIATDAEFKAAFCLWLKSWNQTPPGSLPNDDRLLCRLAELNGNLAKWMKVKRIALRHWILCEDDRLYHPVVAELVVDAANKLKGRQERMANARAARVNNKANHKGNNQALSPQDRTYTETDNVPSGPERAHAREEGFSKNGLKNGASGSAPMSPKRMGHFDGCTCANCARWAEQQRSAL